MSLDIIGIVGAVRNDHHKECNESDCNTNSRHGEGGGAVVLNLGKSSAMVFSVYCPAAGPR